MSKLLSRRNFLKGTAAGTLGVAATTLLGGISLAEEKGIYTPGTYSATANGMGKVKVTMSFDANSITDVQLDLSNETPSIGQAAQEQLRTLLMNRWRCLRVALYGYERQRLFCFAIHESCKRWTLSLLKHIREENAVFPAG